jgi:hypothetical protein
MDTTVTSREADLAAARERVDAIPLGGVNGKLARDPAQEGYGWPPERVAWVERQYRNWLFLGVKYGGETLVPTQELDIYWHNHILDTRAYAQDMQAVFGRFVHHNPYLGAGGAESVRALITAFDRTARLYEQEYGEPFTESVYAG